MVAQYAPQAVLHFFHFTGCCLDSRHSCQAQMRREFQRRLLRFLPRLRLVTAYSVPDLLQNLSNERRPVDLLAMSIGCGGQALKPGELRHIRRLHGGPILIWGTSSAVAGCSGALGVDYLLKQDGEPPHHFLQRTLYLLEGATGRSDH